MKAKKDKPVEIHLNQDERGRLTVGDKSAQQRLAREGCDKRVSQLMQTHGLTTNINVNAELALELDHLLKHCTDDERIALEAQTIGNIIDRLVDAARDKREKMEKMAKEASRLAAEIVFFRNQVISTLKHMVDEAGSDKENGHQPTNLRLLLRMAMTIQRSNDAMLLALMKVNPGELDRLAEQARGLPF